MRSARRLVPSLVALAVFASGWAVPASGQVPVPAPRVPCDALDPALCLLPFPNDRFTTPDSSTATGRRINFLPVEMPRNIAGKPIDPTEWNRNDGFSPGSLVMTHVPNLDLHRTWGTKTMKGARVGGPLDPRDHLADIDRYRMPAAPILLIDATTGERWPFWSELDMHPDTPPDERLLLIRPAVNLLEGHRYLVALRNMRTSTGAAIPANPVFAAYRDNTPAPPDQSLEPGRRAEVDGIIREVERAERGRGLGFRRQDVYLAWSFTVASRRNLTERVLHIRDHAFSLLGDTKLANRRIEGSPPQFRITRITERNDAAKIREVEGTIRVPNYLDSHPLPVTEEVPGLGVPMQSVTGRRFVYGPDGLPMQNPAKRFVSVPFVCSIPRAATPQDRAHPMLYGHGLLGSRFESRGGSTDRARERNFMPCAVNWMGFAEYDIANAALTLLDPSNMPTMADRAQQGFVNFLYLGRAMTHPSGFAAHPAFQPKGRRIVASNALVYDGNSQGGIMGGALTALAVDHTRAVLGVPGMNYSTLLNRSVDWEGPLVAEDAIGSDDPEDYLPSYASVHYTMFPDKQEQQLVMALLQMLWDRAEGNGYAQHMTTDPLPNTPPHQVLLHVALGDFQVANVAAEVEARTIGARVLDTALTADRHWSVDGFFGLEPFERDENGALLPWNGSALVYWDSGNHVPPNANVPPDEEGGDPHEDPRRDPRSGDQRATFWLTGEIVDVMDGQPYLLCRPGAESSIPRVPRLFTIPDWCV